MPAHLEDEAVAAWKHVVDLLTQAGTLECTDPILVETYAINVSVLRLGNKMMKTVDQLDPDDAAFRLINSATMRLKAIIHELGLSPASNKFSLPVNDGANQDAWADVLNVVG
jgi:phage terminase small subunit